MFWKNCKRILCLILALTLCGCALPQQNPETSATLPTQTQPETMAPEPQPQTQPTQPPAVTAATFGELAALAAGDTLRPGDTLRIVGDMEITEPVTFTVPLTLQVESTVTTPSPILFQTRETGIIEILLSPDVDAPAPDLRFDAPNCQLLWPDAPYDTRLQAAEWLNVANYNGTDLRQEFGLGGIGEKQLLSVALDPADNKNLDAPLEFSACGNRFSLAVSYLIPDSLLRSATATLTFSDGTTLRAELDLTQPQLYTVTDDLGQTRAYRIVAQRVTYHLPVVYIDIENGKEVTSRTTYRNATIRIDSESAVGGFPSMEPTSVQIRGRGHFSWNFDKTPYKLRFSEKTAVLGMASSKNWVLLANYLDRSLLQNYVAMEMSTVLTHLPYTASMYPVDVFVNGSYRGVYTLGEQLEAKDERIGLDSGSTPEETDYLLEVGGTDEGDVLNVDYFHAGTLRFVAVKHPEPISREQTDYIAAYVRAADNAVKNLDHYEDYIDVDSLIDWVILHELTYNLDCCFRRSCYLIKEAGGKLTMGPVWDFDLGFGTFYRYRSGDWATVGEEGGYVGITWMNYLKKDPAFMARFAARWEQIRDKLLRKAQDSIDEMYALTAPSAEMNFRVWKILGKPLSAVPASHKQYDTYEKMIDRLKTFLEDRSQWLDEELK